MNQPIKLVPGASRAGKLPEAFSAPKLSKDMDYAVNRRIDRRSGLAPHVPPAAVHAEAAQLLPLWEAICTPVARNQVILWLESVVASIANPPSAEGAFKRIEAVVFACGDLPAAVFTAESAREACRTFSFWPSVAELDKLLRPKAEPLWATRDALRALSVTPAPKPADLPAEQKPEHPTDEERKAIAAAFRERYAAMKAETRAAQEALSPPPDQQERRGASHASPAMLLTMFEQIGQGSTPRAAALRKALGRE